MQKEPTLSQKEPTLLQKEPTLSQKETTPMKKGEKMDDVIKIIGIGLISIILIIIIKQYRPEFAIYISLIAGVIILYFALDKISNIINLLKSICEKSGANSSFLEILIKMTGIAFLAEFAVSICKDSGENTIANKVELGSKAIIISMSIPIIYNLLEVILKILPN